MTQRARFLGFLLFVAIGGAVQYAEAVDLGVNCNKHDSIRRALQTLGHSNPQGPNTITVFGSCKENLVIQSMDRLTLIAKNGASITDPSSGALAVVDIEDSHSVIMQGFTINGGAVGVQCSTASVCYLTGNTVQGAVAVGVEVGAGSHAFLESNVIQNSGADGSFVGDGSQMFSSNDVFQDNADQGLDVSEGAYFVASNSSFLNNSNGILAVASNLLFHGGTISGSTNDGMILLAGSTAVFRDGTTVTGNGAVGVHLEDASFAGFQNATVTGSLSGLDIDCAPQFTITHFVDRTGGITNCVEPASNSQPKPAK